MRRGLGGRPLRLALGTTVAFVGVVGAAYAANAYVGGQATTIQACRNTSNGLLRVVTSNKTGCRAHEAAITWNAQGPKGDPGTQGHPGPQGAVGPQGATGPKGDPGAQGATGSQGLSGAQGPKGDPGLQGPAGPAGPEGPAGGGTLPQAFVASQATPPPPVFLAEGSFTTVVSLDVPAGSYAVTGRAVVSNTASQDAANVTCQILAGGVQADQATTTVIPVSPSPQSPALRDTIPLAGVVTVSTPGVIALQCTVGSLSGTSTVTGTATNGRLMAIEVAATP